jgi:hypothetical protein
VARRKKKKISRPKVALLPLSAGRPSKFDLKRAKRILKAIENGSNLRVASRCGGVSYNCFRHWRLRGRADHKNKVDSLFRWFYVATKEAEDLGECARAETIVNASKKNWQAAAWWLERRRHKRWGRKDMVANLNVPLSPALMGGRTQLPTREELIAETKAMLRMLEGEVAAENGRIEAGGSNGSPATNGDG